MARRRNLRYAGLSSRFVAPRFPLVTGRGGTHWIVYDIPATMHGLKRNAGLHPAPFTGGDIGREGEAYHGPCAEPGAKMPRP